MGISARIDELRKKFEENPRRYFAPLANEYRKAGDLEQAIAICRQHLAEQPAHMSGHIVFGQALYEAGQLDEAGQIFSAALALDPENLIALRHLGDIARGQGDGAAARGWYQRVLDADPRNEEIAALVRELASAVPLEGFAGLPAADAEDQASAAKAPDEAGAAEVAAPEGFETGRADDADPAPPPVRPSFAEAPTAEFVPPRWPTPDAPIAATPAPDAGREAPMADGPGAAPEAVEDVVTAEAPVFEPLALPTVRPSVVLPASALPPERVVEPLPNTLEIPQIDAQRYLEAARRATPATPARAMDAIAAPVPTPVPGTPIVPDAGPEASAVTDELEMPSAEELRHPPAAPEAADDPLADLPMEMLDGFGEASAESLLASGRTAPAPESPLANLEAGVADLDDPEPLIGRRSGQTDAGLEFMDNPLQELAALTPTPRDSSAILDGMTGDGTADALAPEPPLPPPVQPTFEPVEPEDPVAAPRTSAAMPRVSAPTPRVPTPAASPAFVTETMGEVLASQGLHAQAADVYRALLAEKPGDARLSQKLAVVEAQLAPAGWSAREWLQQLAASRLPTPASVAAVPAEVVDDATESWDPLPVPLPTVVAVASAAPTPAAGTPVVAPPTSSLEALFGPPANHDDEMAARALASLYDESAAITGAPTAPAPDELSLKAVFEPPAAPAPRTSAAFSFDQFFAAAPKAATPAPGGADPELAEFTRWLDGLKKQ